MATAIPGSHTEVTEEDNMTEVVDRTQDRRGGERTAPTVYHIPVCPFSQRLEILLTLKAWLECYLKLCTLRFAD